MQMQMHVIRSKIALTKVPPVGFEPTLRTLLGGRPLPLGYGGVLNNSAISYLFLKRRVLTRPRNMAHFPLNRYRLLRLKALITPGRNGASGTKIGICVKRDNRPRGGHHRLG